MNGGDLRFHISRKTLTEDAVRFWMAELACALRYVHKQGIVHRDLKPDNVLLDSEGHVHLADFVRCLEIVKPIPMLIVCRTSHLSLEGTRSCTANPERWHIWLLKSTADRDILTRLTGGL